MIKIYPITVECYSGYKADEYPRAFTLENKRYEIKEVIDRWYQGYLNPEFPEANYFRIETACGNRFLLKHDLKNDKWYVCEK